MKLLLEDPRNVRDALAIAPVGLPPIDFDRLAHVRTTFVARDFRHVEADVVMTAPLRIRGRVRGGAQRRSLVWLYLLLEHQSEPDVLMPVHLLDYIVQIIKRQMRAWARKHGSFAGFRVQPVLPVVLYTGTVRWDSPGRLIDLVDLGELFRDVTPDIKPVYLNLPALEPERLVSAGGSFGRVLRLVQGRRCALPNFAGCWRKQCMSLRVSRRRSGCGGWNCYRTFTCWCIMAHGGRAAELRETIEQSVQADPYRQEIFAMERTIAEGMMEKGRQQGKQQEAVRVRQQTLLRQLRARFENIPEATVAVIESCRDVDQRIAGSIGLLSPRRWPVLAFGRRAERCVPAAGSAACDGEKSATRRMHNDGGRLTRTAQRIAGFDASKWQSPAMPHGGRLVQPGPDDRLKSLLRRTSTPCHRRCCANASR